MNAKETTPIIPKNLPNRMDLLSTGFDNKVMIVPFSISPNMAFVALSEARHRQHIVIVDTPISFIIPTSSPKANMVKEKDSIINKHPPHTIK